MRVAVWELTGDDAPAEVVIFYFGEGSGGGVEANLARWFGQFEQPDGSSTRDRAIITERTVNGLELTVADMRGTFVAPVRLGAPQRNNRPGYRMIGCAPQKVDPALIARFRPVMDRWLLRAGRPDDATDGCFGSQMLAAAA